MCILSPSPGKPDLESRARGASTYFLTATHVPTPQSLDQGTHPLLSPPSLAESMLKTPLPPTKSSSGSSGRSWY